MADSSQFRDCEVKLDVVEFLVGNVEEEELVGILLELEQVLRLVHLSRLDQRNVETLEDELTHFLLLNRFFLLLLQLKSLRFRLNTRVCLGPLSVLVWTEFSFHFLQMAYL